jgi:dUTP pyrophosphatase
MKEKSPDQKAQWWPTVADLIFVVHLDGSLPPRRETPGAAGMDVCAVREGVLFPRQRALVYTGIQLDMPDGVMAMVCSRSGLALNRGVHVLNAPGIIDADYRGEVGVILMNSSDETYHFDRGDRIAQLVFAPTLTATVQVAQQRRREQTVRGAAGFGSTGV